MGFDVTKLEAMVAQSQSQKVVKGVQKSTDPAFPVFGTPVNEDVLMYIPRVNMVTDEEGETMAVLNSVLHDYKGNNSWGSMRCIKGLNNEVFSELGYDGDCPVCKALNECWALYNKKIDLKAKELGLSKNADGSWDDPEDKLAPYRKTFMDEMAINQPTEYVTFPIVVIPKAPNAAKPVDDWKKEAKAYWLHWRKQRYEEKILKQLDSLDENPGHPAGLMWLAKYTYDTKGGKAEPMLAAKNASYSICQNQSKFEEVNAYCETLAKDFTLTKAVETVIAVNFLDTNAIDKKVDTVMKDTRAKLAVLGNGGEVKAIATNINTAAENTLADFGADTKASAPAQTTAPVNTADDDMGVSPVQFE